MASDNSRRGAVRLMCWCFDGASVVRSVDDYVVLQWRCYAGPILVQSLSVHGYVVLW